VTEPPASNAERSPELLFPYATWLQTEGFRSSYCLSASGVPAPDAALLGPAEPPDLGPAPVDALPRLEARLAELFGVERERVIVAGGASGAMHVAALALFPGAHVVTETPCYPALPALAALHGASHASLCTLPADGYALDAAGADRALAGRGPRAGHLFLCQPHNPTGRVLPPDAVRELAEVAARHGGLLVANEVYMEFARPDERHHAFHLAPNTVSIGSLTKAYGLGALRAGWCILGEGVAHERARLLDRAHLIDLDPPTPTLRLARAALDRLDVLLGTARRLEHESRPLLARWLESSPHVSGEVATLGLHAFPEVHGVRDTRALARALAATESLDVVPGELFGQPGHVRVSCALPPATLEEALVRLDRGIAARLDPAG